MNSPGMPRLERTVLSGSVTEPRRELEPSPAMAGLRPLVVLCALSALFVIGVCAVIAWEWLS